MAEEETGLEVKERGYRALMDLFGTTSELSIVYEMMDELLRHDLELRALLIVTINKVIRGRKLARELGVGHGRIRGILDRAMKRGWVSQEAEGYRIARKPIAMGMWQYASRKKEIPI